MSYVQLNAINRIKSVAKSAPYPPRYSGGAIGGINNTYRHDLTQIFDAGAVVSVLHR